MDPQKKNEQEIRLQVLQSVLNNISKQPEKPIDSEAIISLVNPLAKWILMGTH